MSKYTERWETGKPIAVRLYIIVDEAGENGWYEDLCTTEQNADEVLAYAIGKGLRAELKPDKWPEDSCEYCNKLRYALEYVDGVVQRQFDPVANAKEAEQFWAHKAEVASGQPA